MARVSDFFLFFLLDSGGWEGRGGDVARVGDFFFFVLFFKRIQV